MSPAELSVRFRILLSRAASRWLTLAQERRDVLKLNDQLQRDIKSGAFYRTIDDHYAAGVEAQHWHHYKQRFGRTDDEPTFRNRYVLDAIKALDFTSFVNFGSLYGWLESEVKLLGHDAYGVDRGEETRKLNSLEFPGPKFIAADIFDFMTQQRFDGGLFCHINTGTYFLPTFLIKLYETAAAQGFRYIAIWEPSPVSRVTGRYYNYIEAEQPPQVARGPMLLNNYPNLLSRAGYSVLRQEIIKPPHPDPDFRSAFFCAKRRDQGRSR
jgi:hypothetical protein